MNLAKIVRIVSTFLAIVPSASSGQSVRASSFASITGRVVDDDSQLHTAQIQAYQIIVRDGHSELVPKCTTSTEGDGEFRCKGLEGGTFILLVTPGPDQPPAKPPAVGDKPREPFARSFYYPNVTDLSRAERVTVVPAKPTLLDIRLPRIHGWTVSGSLAGVPANADWRLWDYDGHFQLDTNIPVRKNLKTGQAIARGVPDGQFLLTATWLDKGALHMKSGLIVVQGKDVAEFHLQDIALAVVQGTLITTSPTPLEQITLYRCDDTQQKVVSSIKDGHFSFPAVPSGDYFIGLPIRQPFYVAGIAFEGQRMSYDRLHVTDTGSVESVIVETERNSGSLSGAIKDWHSGDPAVQIVVVRDSNGQAFTAPVDGNGSFAMTGLPSGDYHLYAWPLQEGAEYRNPHFLEAHKQDGILVTINAGTSSQVGFVDVKHL